MKVAFGDAPVPLAHVSLQSKSVAGSTLSSVLQQDISGPHLPHAQCGCVTEQSIHIFVCNMF